MKHLAIPPHMRSSSAPMSPVVPGADDSSLGSYNVESTEHDADIDEFSDGLTTQDDGGESTEPEHIDKTMYFGQQLDEKPR